jgi:hypothetical protein
MAILKPKELWYLTCWDDKGNRPFTNIVLGEYKGANKWCMKKAMDYFNRHQKQYNLADWEVHTKMKPEFSLSNSFVEYLGDIPVGVALLKATGHEIEHG